MQNASVPRMAPANHGLVWCLLGMFLVVQGCTSVNTFPAIARAGDTVSLMIGGSENARKDTVSITLTDANDVAWDLQSLGLVRSVFNLRPDGRSKGLHYSPFLDTFISWSIGHEPVQTVLVTDLPEVLPPGQATLTISVNVGDNSSGVSDPFTVFLEIIEGVGESEQFQRSSSGGATAPVDFNRLEPAPHAKISFGENGAEWIGAVSLVVDFDEAVLNPDDINVYVPESTVRGSFVDPGAFGATQRMVYWYQDGLQLYVDAIAPQGIQSRYLQLFLIHPDGLAGPPNFNLVSTTVYDVDANEIIVPVTLNYSP